VENPYTPGILRFFQMSVVCGKDKPPAFARGLSVVGCIMRVRIQPCIQSFGIVDSQLATLPSHAESFESLFLLSR